MEELASETSREVSVEALEKAELDLGRRIGFLVAN
jgi:hypothetical protein